MLLRAVALGGTGGRRVELAPGARVLGRVIALTVLAGLAVAMAGTGTAAAGYVQQRAWGVGGTAEGQFDGPQGITTVPGAVYVADSRNSRIQAFDPLGGFLSTWGYGVQDGLFKREVCTASCRKGIPGQQYGQLRRPTGIDAANGYVFVSDIQNSRIQRFRANGKGPVVTWGGPGSGDMRFNSPVGLSVDTTGHVYVADTGNNRIKKFTANGAFLSKWGNAGSAAGQVQFPCGIAADNAGNVYVADTYNSRIEKFSANGRFLAKWGKHGSANGQFELPYGIATDRSGNVYVADTYNDRIQKFSPRGVFLGKWGKSGSGKGQLSAPQGIAVDGQGAVYVADTGNQRIVKYVRTP